MCGFLALITKNGYVDEAQTSAFRRVFREFIEPRGPDHQLERAGVNFICAQATLSIFGDAPVDFDDGSILTLFSGEIYDWDCPSEVQELTRLGVSEFAKRANDGAFSVCQLSLDASKTYVEKIDLVCDVQGEKRIFIYESDALIVVSSIPGAVADFAVHKHANHDCLIQYLSHRHFIGQRDWWINDVWQIIGGSVAKAERQTGWRWGVDETFRYDWLSTGLESVAGKSLQQVLNDEIAGMTKHQSKGDWGCVVSGGVDSSLVAGLAASLKQTGSNVFITLRFPGKDCSGEEALTLTKLIDDECTHLVEIVTPSEYEKASRRCYKLCAGVMPTHSMASTYLTAKIASAANNGSVRVLYSGEGADELFMGYPWYASHPGLSDWSPYNNDLAHKNLSVQERLDYIGWTKILQLTEREGYTKFDEHLKINSILDFFGQCKHTGFFASDLAGLDNSVEFRTVFGRRNLVAKAISLHPEELLGRTYAQAKLPLVAAYRKKFNLTPVKKVGQAGYPNEMGHLAKQIDLTPVEREIFDKYKRLINARDFEWKVINYKLFKIYNGVM